MKIDLRLRCERPSCHKLIRKAAMWEYEQYKPYCSYQCQEFHKQEMVMEYLRLKKILFGEG